MRLEEEHGGSGLERRLVVLSDDAHNGALVRNVHPPTWKSPEPEGRYNLVVVGAGTAGLVASIGAGLIGAEVALVERHLLGGRLPQLRLRAVQGSAPVGPRRRGGAVGVRARSALR